MASVNKQKLEAINSQIADLESQLTKIFDGSRQRLEQELKYLRELKQQFENI